MRGGPGAPSKSKPKRRRASAIVTEHTRGQHGGRLPSNYKRGAAPTGGPGRAEVEATEKLVTSRSTRVEDLQRRLRRAGYDVAVDGIVGPETRSAWRSYQASLTRSVPHDYLNYSRGAPRGENAERGQLRRATPIVTEHTRGQAHAGPDSRQRSYQLGLPSDYGTSLTPRRSTPGQIETYRREHPAGTIDMLAKLVGTNVASLLIPPVGPTRPLQQEQAKQAGFLDEALLKGLWGQAKHDVRHPLSPVAIADAVALASGGVGAVGRIAAAGKLVAGTERGSRTAAALRGLSYPARVEDLPFTRRLIGHPESGTRALHVGELEVQPATQSPNLLWETGQHLADRLSERIPGVPVVGAASRARRIAREGREVRRVRAAQALAPLAEAKRQISSKRARKFTDEDMAYSFIARTGHHGKAAVADLDVELATKRAALAAIDTAAGGQKAKRSARRLRARINLLEKARPHVLNPSAALRTAIHEGRIVAEATTASKRSRGLREETATEAPARHLRWMYGAEHRPETDTRLGKTTAGLSGARARELNIEKAYQRAVEQVQRLKFDKYGNKRLGLKTPALVKAEARLKERQAELRKLYAGAEKGTTPQLEARLAELDAHFERLYTGIRGPKNPKRKGTSVEQKWLNSQKKSKRKGQPVANAFDMLNEEAEAAVRATIEKRAHLPVGREWKARLDERDRIIEELAEREKRATVNAPKSVLDDPDEFGYLTGSSAPKGKAPAMLHPHLPTTHEAIKEELRRVGNQYAELKGRVTELPTVSGASIPLRETIRPLEKAMRAAEAEWNKPVVDVLAQRAALNRIRREGGTVVKALAAYEKAGGPPGKVPGLKNFEELVDELTETIKEGRGPTPDDLLDLRKAVNGLRAELRAAEKPRAHIVPGEVPYALDKEGKIVYPEGTAKVRRLAGARSHAIAQRQALEKRAASAVEDTGMVSPPRFLAGNRPGKGMAEVPASWPERGADFEKRWDELPDDAEVIVFHSTDPARAERFAKEGIDPANKPVSLARQRHEAGGVATFQPGAGLSGGLTVGHAPMDVSGYGRTMIAVRVKKGDLTVSPEQVSLGGEGRVGEALRVNDAEVLGSIPASDVKVLDLGGKVPNDRTLAQVAPHVLRPGKLGFQTPDVPNIPRLARAGRGHIKSANPPRSDFKQATGTLYREGRERVGPSETLREAVREIRHGERVKGVEMLHKVSHPVDREAMERNPKRWQLMDLNAATPGRALPRGTKAATSTEKRAIEELPIEMEADEALNPQRALERLKEGHEALMDRVFPKLNDVDDADLPNLRMVERRWVKAVMGDEVHVSNLGGRALDLWNQYNRAGLIYLNTAYVPVQGTGNALYVGLQTGPWGARKIPRYIKRYNQLEPEVRRRMTMEVGGGAAAELAHEGVGAGPLTKLADFQNMLADKYPRNVAWLHEADRMGYRTPEQITDLLTNSRHERHLNVVSDRAQQAMVKFRRYPTTTRRMIGRAIFIAPWLEGSTRWLGRFLADRPFTAAAAAHVREHIIEHQKKVLGESQKVTGGFIPTGIPAKLASKASFGLLSEPSTREQGLKLTPGNNPDPISPTGSGAGVLKGLAELAGFQGPPVHGGTRVEQGLQPSIGALLAVLTGRSSYSGFEYKPDTKLFGNRALGILKEETIGSLKRPGLPIASTIKTAFDETPDLAERRKEGTLPLYYPEAGPKAAIIRAVRGSTRTRRLIDESAAAQAKKATREEARGNKGKLAKLNVQTAMLEGRKTREDLTAATRELGWLKPGEELPIEVREAIRRKTIRYAHYAQVGADSEEERFAADLAQMLKFGWIDQAYHDAGMEWLDTALRADVEKARAAFGREAYQGKNLSKMKKAIKDEQARRRATVGG